MIVFDSTPGANKQTHDKTKTENKRRKITQEEQKNENHYDRDVNVNGDYTGKNKKKNNRREAEDRHKKILQRHDFSEIFCFAWLNFQFKIHSNHNHQP